MGFPAKLTDEEQALLSKYELFKKKKKSGNSHKTNNVAIHPVEISKQVSAAILNKVEPARENVSKESPMKPKDAKEIAKKLIASGQVKINKDSENRSFKRARPSTGERKQRASFVSEAAFNAKTQQQPKKIENIRRDSYNKFVAEVDRSDDRENSNNQNSSQRRSFDGRSGQRNLFISGFGLTKYIIDTAFDDFGPIKNRYFDPEKSIGYVTYHRPDSAMKAIDELHGSQVEGVILKVAYARKRSYNLDDNRFTSRPTGVKPDDNNRKERFFTDNRAHNSDTSRHSDDSPPKRNEAKKRKVVIYEDDEFNF